MKVNFITKLSIEFIEIISVSGSLIFGGQQVWVNCIVSCLWKWQKRGLSLLLMLYTFTIVIVMIIITIIDVA